MHFLYLWKISASKKKKKKQKKKKKNNNKETFFEKMDKMADDALASGSPGNTIKEVTKEDILHIYKKLWEA